MSPIFFIITKKEAYVHRNLKFKKSLFFVASNFVVINAFADEIVSKLNRLQGTLSVIAFAVGGVAAVGTLIGAMVSERMGWAPFFRVSAAVAVLAILNAFLFMLKNTLGGY
jgi:predicted MFS family arabinose efflux permease